MEFSFICIIMHFIGLHSQIPETGHTKQDQATQPIGRSEEKDGIRAGHREEKEL